MVNINDNIRKEYGHKKDVDRASIIVFKEIILNELIL